MDIQKLSEKFLSYGDGYGYGAGDGAGVGDGAGYGAGTGTGAGYGDGTGTGAGAGAGTGYGHGFGDGFGFGVDYSINGNKVLLIDGIRTILTRIRANVAQGFIVNEDETLTKTFVVKDPHHRIFAHGETLQQAYEALQKNINKGW